MVGDIRSFVTTLLYWGLMDVIIPLLILLVILFFLILALIDFVKFKVEIKVIISAISGTLLSLLLMIYHLTGFSPNSFDLVNFINMILPQIILLTIPYFISLFPLLILIKSKKYLRIFILLLYIVFSVFEPSNILLLLLPLSIMSLMFKKRNKVIQSISIQRISFIILFIGIMFFVSLLLSRNTIFYQFIGNTFGIKNIYLTLVFWICSWLIQALVTQYRINQVNLRR